MPILSNLSRLAESWCSLLFRDESKFGCGNSSVQEDIASLAARILYESQEVDLSRRHCEEKRLDSFGAQLGTERCELLGINMVSVQASVQSHTRYAVLGRGLDECDMPFGCWRIYDQ